MSFIWIMVLAVIVFVMSVVAQGPGSIAVVAIIVLIPSSLALYFSPSIVAVSREHPNTRSIIVLNILLGWSGLGWIGALVWAYSAS